MPVRSTPFQHLIAQIHQQLHSRATVTESKELVDRVTGELREVDVVIEEETGGFRFVLCVECVERGRRADVTWVDTMASKHQFLPTNKLLLVAKAGFTAPAIRKAAALGYETVTLDEAASSDWAQVLTKVLRMFVAQSSFQRQGCSLIYANPEDSVEGITLESILYTPEGIEWGSVYEFTRQLVELAAPDFLAQPDTEGLLPFRIEHDVRPGVYLIASAGEHILLREVRVWGLWQHGTTTIPLNHRSYNNANVAWATPNVGGIRSVLLLEREGQPGVGVVEMEDSSAVQSTQTFDLAFLQDMEALTPLQRVDSATNPDDAT